MSALDDMPIVPGFFGLDLKTCALLVATLGIVHPMAYACTCFIPMSYLLVTVWILVTLYFAASVGLFCGVIQDNALLCAMWVWYTAIFVCLMVLLMVLLALVFTSRRQPNRVFVVLLGMLWYILTIYFILIVNSHRKVLESGPTMDADDATTILTTALIKKPVGVSSVTPMHTTTTTTK